MKKFILLAIIFLSLIWVFQRDDGLSPEAIELLSQVDYTETSEAYLYLLGIFSHETKNPKLVGKAILKEYKKQELDESYQITPYPHLEKLKLPEGPLLCWVSDPDCLKYILENAENIKTLVEQNKALISRSNQFLAFKEFKTLTRPSFIEPVPYYRYLVVAENIKLLSAISSYKQQDYDQAIATLENQFIALRESLVFQDTIIGKFVLINLLSNTLDVLSMIHTATGLQSNYIEHLTPEERDLTRAAAREFMAHAHFLEQEKSEPFKDSKEINKARVWIKKFAYTFFYKVNMTINLLAPTYQNLIDLAQLTPLQFTHKVKIRNKIIPNFNGVRNPIGQEILSNNTDYAHYPARIFNLQVKIDIFNHLYHQQKSLTTAPNTYYEEEVVNVVNHKVCFKIPINESQEKEGSCMLIKGLEIAL